MEFQEAILSRRTVRDFSARAVDPAITKAAMAAAFAAPTHDHLRNWDFLFLNDPAARIALVDAEGIPETVSEGRMGAFDGLEPSARAMYRDAVPKQRSMLLEAPDLDGRAHRNRW